MLSNTPCDTIAQRKCLELRYNGLRRLVEIHAVGYTSDGNAIMRVWQVSGGSNSGEVPGWKLLRLDEVSGMAITDTASQAPRAGYKRGDRHMLRIVCQA